jgi:hypothetical protein
MVVMSIFVAFFLLKGTVSQKFPFDQTGSVTKKIRLNDFYVYNPAVLRVGIQFFILSLEEPRVENKS